MNAHATNPSDAAREKVQELHILEQSIANIGAQKQQFQLQQSEVSSALTELKGASKAYHIVGGLMIEKSSATLITDLNAKHELLEVRIKSIESQERKMQEKKDALQKEVMRLLQTGNEDAGDDTDNADTAAQDTAASTAKKQRSEHTK